MTSLPGATWFVGCGNMAGAMVEGWRKAGIDFAGHCNPAERQAGRRRPHFARASRRAAAALVLLGFKPQKLDEVAPQLAPKLGPETVVISILAGVEVASLRQRFPNAAAIVRAMPNLPVSEGRGVIALYSEDADAGLREQLSELFRSLGRTHWAHDEAEFAAIGSIAGAGPAYVARFIAALAGPGRRGGWRRARPGGRVGNRCSAPRSWPERGARQWTRSHAASPAPTARPRRASPCLTMTTRLIV